MMIFYHYKIEPSGDFYFQCCLKCNRFFTDKTVYTAHVASCGKLVQSPSVPINAAGNDDVDDNAAAGVAIIERLTAGRKQGKAERNKWFLGTVDDPIQTFIDAFHVPRLYQWVIAFARFKSGGSVTERLLIKHNRRFQNDDGRLVETILAGLVEFGLMTKSFRFSDGRPSVVFTLINF